MLGVYFLHHRELLGELSRAAYETIHELMTPFRSRAEHSLSLGASRYLDQNEGSSR
jgi:hypothetical protein